ncbi:MAG: hypothetical protein FJX65_17160 [Alphaproteobacteria bacterium]|nr:hypothetical protein [Alphaproteobacteria bacterium]
MTLSEAIDAIEEAYEFMLAYAAQGRDSDASRDGKSAIRQQLESAEAALAALPGLLADAAARFNGVQGEATRAFSAVVEQDGARARAAIRFVLAQPGIGSPLVDNLNGSIHLRTMLTDLFLIDDALKPVN